MAVRLKGRRSKPKSPESCTLLGGLLTFRLRYRFYMYHILDWDSNSGPPTYLVNPLADCATETSTANRV